jgi:5-methylthioribose kinase
MISAAGSTDPYRVLDRESLPDYLAGIPSVVAVLGSGAPLEIVEVGDGNLNFVYRVTNAEDASRSVIVKQAVPYLRMVGEDWPLSRDRINYEIRALTRYNDLVPDLVPTIYYADEAMSVLIMQCLDDHIILRLGMIDGIKYPSFARHTGLFMAETLFATSAWAMDSIERRELMNQFTMNTELCKLTEEFIFLFPYMEHESNYSNPATDAWAKEHIHTDVHYKLDVLRFKNLFVSKTDALLHGDLHSGSMMVNQADTYVIDMEFAFFGPMGFDIGKVVSNIILCCTSHYHRTGGADYREWLLEQIPVVWNTFEARFLALWRQSVESALVAPGFLDEQDLVTFQSEFMLGLLRESAGFASCSMARRTLGIAGVADIRDIEQLDVRSRLEIANLQLSKMLMAERHTISSISDLLTLVRGFYASSEL